jgi:hypothetical protein
MKVIGIMIVLAMSWLLDRMARKTELPGTDGIDDVRDYNIDPEQLED